jgi:hypothetical protein
MVIQSSTDVARAVHTSPLSTSSLPRNNEPLDLHRCHLDVDFATLANEIKDRAGSSLSQPRLSAAKKRQVNGLLRPNFP